MASITSDLESSKEARIMNMTSSGKTKIHNISVESWNRILETRGKFKIVVATNHEIIFCPVFPPCPILLWQFGKILGGGLVAR